MTDAPTPPPASASIRPKGRTCPICRRKASENAYPFCSERCADVDLHRWLSDAYVVSAAPGDPPEAGGED